MINLCRSLLGERIVSRLFHLDRVTVEIFRLFSGDALERGITETLPLLGFELEFVQLVILIFGVGIPFDVVTF